MLRLGASAGAAVFPHDATSYEALLAAADQRMYRDKSARRAPLTLPRPSAPDTFIETALYPTPRPGRAIVPLPQSLA